MCKACKLSGWRQRALQLATASFLPFPLSPEAVSLVIEAHRPSLGFAMNISIQYTKLLSFLSVWTQIYRDSQDKNLNFLRIHLDSLVLCYSEMAVLVSEGKTSGLPSADFCFTEMARLITLPDFEAVGPSIKSFKPLLRSLKIFIDTALKKYAAGDQAVKEELGKVFSKCKFLTQICICFVLSRFLSCLLRIRSLL